MVSFDIVIQTQGSLHVDGEPDDFISAYAGIIRCVRDKDGRVFKVGKVRAYRIHAALAREAGESVFHVCDAHSQELHDVYAALFDVEQDDLKDEVSTQLDAFDPDVLVLDYVLLSPRWRGLKLGLLAARKLIDMVGGGCGLVAADIAPLNADATEFAKVPAGWVPKHRSGEERSEAKRKLRRHFKQMGFQRIKGTRFHGLSLSQVTPTLADLIRPTR